MPTPVDPLVAQIVELLDEDLRDEFEERAGIVQFDGGLPRAHAECLALLILLQRHPEAIVGLTVLEMHEDGETYWLLTTEPAMARRYAAERGGKAQNLGALIEVIKTEHRGFARLAPVAFSQP